MKRLILTTSDSGAGCLRQPGIADAVIPIGDRFFLPEPRPSHTEFLESLEDEWLERISRKYLGEPDQTAGITELCEAFDTVDAWIDPDPNAQLILSWLLDYFGPIDSIVSKLHLVQADVPIGNLSPDEAVARRIPVIKIGDDHLKTGSMARKAFLSSTPLAWFGLLSRDLSALPLLRPAVVALLEELPGLATGLGATEMRMLEMIGEGVVAPFDVFPGHEKRNTRRVFSYWETGTLLEKMARAPAPAVSGLKEGPFTPGMHDDRGRHERYKQSKLSLTALGRDILAGREDFSRHNPVRRWWGFTELTNDRLWRWDAAKQALIAP